MGGTDRRDQNVNCYRFSIRMKKWWWAIFTWIIDSCLQNCWILHDISLVTFRRYIANTYLQQAQLRVKSGRHRFSSNVISDVRFDNFGHYVIQLGKQAWKYVVKECKFRPSQECVKCNVAFVSNVLCLTRKIIKY